jgi:hypothetical protein
MLVERFTPAAHSVWDDFVRSSKNGTFLLERDYMDHHADRFADYSLLVRDDEGALVALLPANADGASHVSHGGLTYGGFITGAGMKTPLMLAVFEVAADYLRAHGFKEWRYKTIPHIYHRFPAEEDVYALFLAGAILCRRDVLTVIDLRGERPPYQQRRHRSVQKARNLGLAAAADSDLATYWAIVSENLRQRHDAAPVHSLAEIERLRDRFPQNIRLYTCRDGERNMLGGVLIYESTRVAHVQYIASTEQGRRQGAIDLLFDTLLTDWCRDKAYFDFGISNENGGRVLNRGLIDQKEGFGARAVAHDQYLIDLSQWESGRLTGAMR